MTQDLDPLSDEDIAIFIQATADSQMRRREDMIEPIPFIETLAGQLLLWPAVLGIFYASFTGLLQ